MSVLRIGLLGASRIAPRAVLAPAAKREDVQVTVISARDRERASTYAKTYGVPEIAPDYSALIGWGELDLIYNALPAAFHCEWTIAALEAGKHVLCEKPLANTVAEAEAMAEAAAKAAARGVRSMVGFTYRRVPAIGLARQLVAEGRLGQIRHVRAQYLQDWIADPTAPMSWRLDKDKAGSGALGDIGAHIVDLTQHITGQTLTGVSALLETFVTERPLPAAAGSLAGVAGEGTGAVTVDDAAVFIGRFSGGALASFEATRFALGRKNAIRIEINGSRGSLAFDFEDMNVLHFFDGDEPDETAGFRRIVVTEPGHPYVGAWWPAGHGLGYEHGFTHQVVDLVTAIAENTDPAPSFADGLQVQRVLDAVERSAADSSRWTDIPGEI